jgi:hypothetical protein
MRKHKLTSSKYSVDDMAALHAEGKITDRQMWRAGGVCVDHINDPAYQRDNARATGLPGTRDYGHPDATTPEQRGCLGHATMAIPALAESTPSTIAACSLRKALRA